MLPIHTINDVSRVPVLRRILIHRHAWVNLAPYIDLLIILTWDLGLCAQSPVRLSHYL
jgi:hypothetical protein